MKSRKNYNFKKRSFTSGPHLLGMIFIGAGVFTLISPLLFEQSGFTERAIWAGSGVLFLGLIIASSYEGTLIDFDNSRLKEYFSFMGLRFGKWSSLPTISRIVVISVRHNFTNTPNGINPTWGGTVTRFKVLLFSTNVKAELSFMFSNKERAVKDAKSLSKNLNLPLELRISKV